MPKKRNVKSAKKNDSQNVPWENSQLFLEAAFDIVKMKLRERGYPGSCGIVAPAQANADDFGLAVILMPGAAFHLPVFYKIREELRQDHIKMVKELFPDIDEESLDLAKVSELLETTHLENAEKFAGSAIECPRMFFVMKKLEKDDGVREGDPDIQVLCRIEYGDQTFGYNGFIYPFFPDNEDPEEWIYDFLEEMLDDFLFATWDTISTKGLQTQLFANILTLLAEYIPAEPADRFADMDTAFLQIPSPAYIQPGNAMRKKVEAITGTFSQPNLEEARFTLIAKYDPQEINIELRGPNAVDTALAQSVAQQNYMVFCENEKPIFKTKIKMADFKIGGPKSDPLTLLHKFNKKCNKIVNDILKCLGVPLK